MLTTGAMDSFLLSGDAKSESEAEASYKVVPHYFNFEAFQNYLDE
jgi:hypothetical protein